MELKLAYVRRSASGLAQGLMVVGLALACVGVGGTAGTKYVGATGAVLCGLVSLWYLIRASWLTAGLQRAGWTCLSLGSLALVGLALTYAIREVWWSGTPPWVFFDVLHSMCMVFVSFGLLLLKHDSAMRTCREFLDKFALGTACTMLLWSTPYGQIVFRHGLIATFVKGVQFSAFVVVLSVCLSVLLRSRRDISVFWLAAGWLLTFSCFIVLALIAASGLRLGEGYFAVPVAITCLCVMVGAVWPKQTVSRRKKLPILPWLTTMVICMSVITICVNSPNTLHHKMVVIGQIVVMSVAITLRNALYSCEVRGLVGQLQQRKSELAYEVRHDHMTGLENRASFMARVEESLAVTGFKSTTVALLDIDSFKEVNDMKGHAFGNAVLLSVAESIKGLVPAGVSCARVGGDEFGILFSEECDAPAILDGIADAMLELDTLEGTFAGLSVSIGLATCHAGDSISADDLINRADMAMYLAKHGDSGSCVQHSSMLTSPFLDDRVMKPKLAQAIKDAQVRTLFQPIYDLTSGVLKGFEALSRWNCNGTQVSPARFIGLAERSGLIEDLTYLVLHRACQQIALWRRSYPQTPVVISVNVTGPSLADPSFLSRVTDIAAEYGVHPRALTLELTESLPIRDMDSVISTLTAAREAGMGVALDDFGTGCNSIAHLLQLPQSIVKIDPAMIRGIEVNETRVGVVAGMVGLAKQQELSVVAEGVENHQQLEILRELDVDYVQGFLLGKPEEVDFWVDALSNARSVHLVATENAEESQPEALGYWR